MRVGRVLLGLAAVVVLGGGAFLALAWRPAIDPVEPPDRASFDPARMTKGAELAAVGDCGRCHTVEGGAAYAGGYPLATPFGTIYATNITPDPETGIGRWSEAAFRRAMREGVDREGRHLYPAFPYDHFAKASDEDLTAVYAFLMTRDPVRATAPPNELPFPYNVRLLLAGWNLLFLDKAPFRPDPGQDAARNRGAYLAESLGHCGACHTPRNKLGAEEKDRPYAGGEAEGWHAPALDASSPAPVRWTEADLFAYLRTGFSERHGLAAGPMGPVARNLAAVPEADVRAIAGYVASLAGPPAPDQDRRAEVTVASAEQRALPFPGTAASEGDDPGAAVFASACATCHHAGAGPPFVRPVPLALSSVVTGPDPRNLVRIILDGIRPPEGEAGPMMPGFAGALTDQQVTALVAYVRSHFASAAAWEGAADRVREIRQEGRPA